MKVIDEKVYLTKSEEVLVKKALMINFNIPVHFYLNFAKQDTSIQLDESYTVNDYQKALMLFRQGKYEIIKE